MITLAELKQYLSIEGNSQVASFTITSQGADITSCIISFTGGGSGSGAAADAVLDAGKLIGVTITNAGQNYTQTPTPVFTCNPGATLPVATANMGSPFLQSCADEAISAIIQQCNRDFRLANYTDYVKGMGNAVIWVKNFPLNSVTTLQKLNESTGAWEDIIDGSGDSIANSTFINTELGRLQLLKDYTFPDGGQVKIVYSGGYTIAPAEIKGVCLEIAALYYKNGAGEGRLGQQSQNIGGQSSTGMSFNEEEFFARHQQRLDKYRNINV